MIVRQSESDNIGRNAWLALLMQHKWKTEIELAIDKVKLGVISAKPRTNRQKWWRKQFYRARAMDKRIGPRIEMD